MATIRFQYFRLNIKDNMQQSSARDFEGPLVNAIILFLNFLNEQNKAGAGQWQYWAVSLDPIQVE